MHRTSVHVTQDNPSTMLGQQFWNYFLLLVCSVVALPWFLWPLNAIKENTADHKYDVYNHTHTLYCIFNLSLSLSTLEPLSYLILHIFHNVVVIHQTLSWVDLHKVILKLAGGAESNQTVGTDEPLEFPLRHDLRERVHTQLDML